MLLSISAGSAKLTCAIQLPILLRSLVCVRARLPLIHRKARFPVLTCRRGIRYFGEQLPILTPEINASTLRIYLSLSRIYLVKNKKKEKIGAGVVGPNIAPQLGEHPPERSPTL